MKFVDDPLITKQLYPFTLTRSIADIRVGITTIREKWASLVNPAEEIEIPSHLLPSAKALQAIRSGSDPFEDSLYLSYPWTIFQHNDKVIRQDFGQLTYRRRSLPVPESCHAVQVSKIFIEEGAKVEHCILNASTGPIYVGKNAEIMEGSCIRGPFALCEGAVVKMGTRIYGATTIGPYSVVAGEIKNAVIFGYSNKAHDGYLGDSVIGEWCNLGAGTSNSNVKNTGNDVKVWSEAENRHLNAGIKCGLLMGDYSRSAINTSFNTGTVVGVCANVFGKGLSPAYIPSFTWGFDPPLVYEQEKALKDISNWKKFKNQSLTEQEISKLNSIFANLNKH